MEVAVGRVAKAHGVHGELAVQVSTDSPEVRFAPGAVLTAQRRDRSTLRLTVGTVRPHGDRLLVTSPEVPSREVAEALRGALLLADTAALPPIEDPDEFYDHELEGLAVVTVDGAAVGTVTEVLHGPGGELLAVDADGREVLVPFVAAIVPTVDVPGGRITVDPPDGLLDG